MIQQSVNENAPTANTQNNWGFYLIYGGTQRLLFSTLDCTAYFCNFRNNCLCVYMCVCVHGNMQSIYVLVR